MLNWKFIPSISNVKQFLDVVNHIKDAPAYRPKIAVITAKSGIGKTETSQWYKGKNFHSVFYIPVSEAMNTKALLSTIYKEISQDNFVPRGSIYELYLKIVDLINEQEDQIMLIFDEANRLAKKEKQIEILRDIHDNTGIPMLFIGTDEFIKYVVKYEAFYGRISIKAELKPLSETDIKKIIDGLSDGELTFTKDAIKYLAKFTGGNTRKLIVNLGIIEKVARANDLKEISKKELMEIFTK
jgi:DNA transposition AAA+ family ATPase